MGWRACQVLAVFTAPGLRSIGHRSPMVFVEVVGPVGFEPTTYGLKVVQRTTSNGHFCGIWCDSPLAL